MKWMVFETRYGASNARLRRLLNMKITLYKLRVGDGRYARWNQSLRQWDLVAPKFATEFASKIRAATAKRECERAYPHAAFELEEFGNGTDELKGMLSL